MKKILLAAVAALFLFGAQEIKAQKFSVPVAARAVSSNTYEVSQNNIEELQHQGGINWIDPELEEKCVSAATAEKLPLKTPFITRVIRVVYGTNNNVTIMTSSGYELSNSYYDENTKSYNLIKFAKVGDYCMLIKYRRGGALFYKNLSLEKQIK